MTLKDDLREYRRKLAELERLERTDTLPLCILCNKNAREVSDLCGQCWRARWNNDQEHDRAQDARATGPSPGAWDRGREDYPDTERERWRSL